MLEPQRRGFFKRRQFVSNIVRVSSNLVGNSSQFNSQKISHRGDSPDYNQHYQRRTDEAAEVALEAGRDGTEDHAQNESNRKRKQDRSGEIQSAGSDNQCADRYGNP